MNEEEKERTPKIIILFILVFLAFLPVLRAGFVNWDDTSHILENANVKFHSWENLVDIFRRTVNRTYIPLTIFSFHAEHALVGFRPFLYHFDNLLLHILATLLVFRLARQWSLSPVAAFVGALLFGIHPMHVESVAWITGRKDVLYSIFYLLALLAYGKYIEKFALRDYAFALLFGVLSIFAKPMALSLPIVLILLDVMGARNWKDYRIWIEKVPFFLCIAPMAWVTFSLNSRIPEMAFPRSLWIWLWTFSFYLKKFFFPYTQAVVYPLPEPVGMGNPEYLTAVVIFFLFIFLFQWQRKNRWVLFACVFYAASTFFLWRYDGKDPNIVADRFMYLPSLGFCLLLGWYVEKFLSRVQNRGTLKYALARGGVSIIIGVLILKTFLQCQLWQDGTKLWGATLATAPQNPELLLNMANSLGKEGKYDEALELYDKVVALAPDYVEAYDKRGVIYDEVRNQPDLALKEFDTAIRRNASYTPIYYHKGNTLSRQQKFMKAMDSYNQALQLNPTFAEGYINRGYIQLKIFRNYESALADFNRAIDLDPSFAEEFINRGWILSNFKGDDALAIADFTQAITLDPAAIDAYLNRARLYRKLEKYDLAFTDYEDVLHLQPQNSVVLKEYEELKNLLHQK